LSISVTRSDFKRIVVAIDPAATSNEDSDDTGIVVVARGPHQPATCSLDHCPGHGFVLEDCTCHLHPHGWAKVAIDAYDRWQADRIVAEVNNGGDMVAATIHAVRIGVPYSTVHATRGKQMRAEPISALYEQGRVHHLGVFPELEMQQTTWTPDATWSPDRLDALVWGLTELGLIGDQGHAFLTAYKREIEERAPATSPALAHLPRLGGELAGSEVCVCAKRRIFDGRCTNCGGSDPRAED
jgi:phage terminase large subunit-like protein